jgi:hypothetical protein
MLALRALPLAFVLTKLVVAQQTISIPTEEVDEFAPISMAKAPVRLCSLTGADSTRKAGGSRPGLWCPINSESSHSISVDSDARPVPAKGLR